MSDDHCAICGLRLGALDDGGLCAPCRDEWEDDSEDELADMWPSMPLDLDGLDLFSDYPFTGIGENHAL